MDRIPRRNIAGSQNVRFISHLSYTRRIIGSALWKSRGRSVKKPYRKNKHSIKSVILQGRLFPGGPAKSLLASCCLVACASFLLLRLGCEKWEASAARRTRGGPFWLRPTAALK
jgi:hypothetical protein